jgi:hypothetical protein
MGCAIAVTEENIRGIIRSEAGSTFDIDIALAWLAEQKEGWFLRDDRSIFDCHLFASETFAEMYKFTQDDQNSIMRHVESI